MLKCRDVAHHASDYLDANGSGAFGWQMRMHLLLCANCRRFVRHLDITRKTVRAMLLSPPDPATDPEAPDYSQILARVQAQTPDPDTDVPPKPDV